MAEQPRVEQHRLSIAFAADEPPGQRGQSHRSDGYERADFVAPFLPHEDAEHDSAHAEHRQEGADEIDLPRAQVRHVLDETDLAEYDGDDDGLQPESDSPREISRYEPAEQRPDGGGDGGGRADQRVRLLLGF